MRRFELVEGSSSKFWEISLDGKSFDVRWGRIGTNGQAQTKSFPTEAKAQAEHDKLVKEKTGKGYVEVGGGAPATPAPAAAPKAAAPKAAATKAATPKAAAPKADPATAPPEVAPPPSVDAAPSVPNARASAGASVPARSVVLTIPSTWPADRRAHLHPRPAWSDAVALDRAAIWKKVRERAGKTKSTAKVSAETKARLAASAPEAPASFETERELATLLGATKDRYGDIPWALAGLELAVDHWAATGGVAHAIRTWAQLLGGDAHWVHNVDHGIAWRLAELAVSLPAAERAALAEDPSLSDLKMRALRARLFPEHGDADRELRSPTPGAHGTHHRHHGAYALSATALDAVRAVSTTNVWAIRVGCGYRAMSLSPVLYTWIALFGADAASLIEPLFDGGGDSDSKREVAEALAFVASAEVFTRLIARANDKHVVQALRDAAIAHPTVALVPLLDAALGRGQTAAPARSILAHLVRMQAGEGSVALEAAIDTLGPAGRKLVAELRDKQSPREEASDDALPRFLVSPPWLAKKAKGATTTVSGLAPLPFEETMVWPEGLEERWRAWEPPPWAKSQMAEPNHYAMRWGIPRDLAERLGERDDAADDAALAKHAREKTARYFSAYGTYLLDVPARLAGKLIGAYASERWWGEDEAFRRLAATEGLAFLDPFLAYAEAHLEGGLELLLPYRSPRVAMLAADALHRLKKKPPGAKAWLLAHPEAAAIGLVPVALGASGKRRDAAESALRLLAAEGHEGLVMDVAARHGEPARAATRAVLDFDPLELFPSKIPSLPDFASPAALPPLVLREGGKALPASAMTHALTMLAISQPGEPYAGVTKLIELTTRASQADLAWELFSAWGLAGMPSSGAWAFTAMGWLGDDECVRKITPRIRAWPGESLHQRAVAGLDVLAAIGTDVALMHLHGIAQKLKFKGLQEKAREKIDQIAEARGLTADELTDRLVPDIGLDADGSLTLDFGPRSFRVVFDETLKPLVKDADGKLLGDLPKPKKDDDAEKAGAAVDTWKALKKDAKTIAQQQVTRLELAMCARRRWTLEVFQRFLVEHPLVRHLVLRLAWGAYDASGALLAVFRVAEDGTFASPDDEAYTLPEGASVGVAHTLETRPEDEAKLAQIFGDYELVQPFPQLGRETFRLTDAERAATVVERWKGKKLPTGKVVGLEARGWRRGQPQDAGHIGWMEKTVGAQTFSIDLDPGISVGDLSFFPEQEVIALGLGVDIRWQKNQAASKLGTVDPIVMSELLRDIEKLYA